MDGKQRPFEPYFSIVIPTLNRPELLGRALASICLQTFRDFEVIIVDDGSKPPSIGVMEAFSNLPLRFIYCPGSGGAASARNAGIAQSRGQFIAFLDDDDEYLPSFLQNTHETIEREAGRVHFTVCGAELVDYDAEHNRPLSIARQKVFNFQGKEKSFISELLSFGIGFGGTVRADCLRAVGGFDETLRTVEDTDLFFRLLTAHYSAAVVEGVHVRIHNHRQPRLTGVANHHKRIEECHGLLRRYACFLSKHPILHERLRLYISQLSQALGQGAKAMGAPPAVGFALLEKPDPGP